MSHTSCHTSPEPRQHRARTNRTTRVLMVSALAIGLTVGFICISVPPGGLRKSETSRFQRDSVTSKLHLRHGTNKRTDSTKNRNQLLDRYVMSQILNTEERKARVDGLLKFVESDFISKSTAVRSAKELAKIVQASTMTVDDVINLASSYRSDGSLLRALVLFYTGGKLGALKCDKHVTDRMSFNIAYTAEELVKIQEPKFAVRGYVIPLLGDLIDDAPQVTCSNDFKVTQMASYLRSAALAHCVIGDYKASVTKSKVAGRLLRKKLGLDVNKHKIYALCMDSRAFSYIKMQSYKKALRYYEKTLEAYKAATDFDTLDEKQSYIEQAAENVRMLKDKVDY